MAIVILQIQPKHGLLKVEHYETAVKIINGTGIKITTEGRSYLYGARSKCDT